MKIRLAMALCALSLAAASGPAAAAPATGFSQAQYDAVLAGSWRSPQNRARDVYRHPVQTLQFFGLKPGQTVIEITPGGGWYSEILAPLLSGNGHYLAAVFAPATDEGSAKAEAALARKFSFDPARYGKAQIVAFDASHPSFGAPASADLVLTFRNVHNWTTAGTAPAMFKGFFEVLKPGGVLGVVDHRAAPGAGDAGGYLPVEQVVKLASDAGFKLDAQSEINANPKDTKNYPKGVWTLPPTLVLGSQDRARYLAIGESDRMTLRFVKPISVP